MGQRWPTWTIKSVFKQEFKHLDSEFKDAVSTYYQDQLSQGVLDYWSPADNLKVDNLPVSPAAERRVLTQLFQVIVTCWWSGMWRLMEFLRQQIAGLLFFIGLLLAVIVIIDY